MDLTLIFFIILSALAIASAIVTISSKHPVVSAMALVVHFFILSGLYLTLQAQFVAVMQILVYAGAIMVLVVFVIMLLNLGNEDILKEKYNFRKVAALLLALVLVVQFLSVYLTNVGDNSTFTENAIANGTVQAIGSELFTNYLFQFEAIAILLLMAIVGALLLAKRKLI